MNVRLAVAATAGATLLAVSSAATAAATIATASTPAAGPVAAKLPVPNRALTTTVSVEDATLTVHGTQITVDLQGPAALVMRAPATGQTEARAAYKQQLTGTHPELGRITVTTESTADSRVTYTSFSDSFPAKLDLPSDVTVEIENAPGAGTRNTAEEPLLLSTGAPGKLVGRLDAFPPQGEIFHLQNPIDLVVPDNPEKAIGSLDEFPVKVGGL